MQWFSNWYTHSLVRRMTRRGFGEFFLDPNSPDQIYRYNRYIFVEAIMKFVHYLYFEYFFTQ